MHRPATAAVAAFSRRVVLGAAAQGALHGLALGATALAAAQLVARAAGAHLPPSPWWALAALPVAGLAAWRVRRLAWSPAAAAGHLDRRLALDGLLVCAAEGAGLEPAFAARLDAGLAALPAALPRLQWRRLLPAPCLAALLAAGVALLPPPVAAAAAPAPTQLLAAELQRLDTAMRALFERGAVPEEVQRDLQRQLGQLQQAAAQGELPEWREVDDLEARLQREELLQAAAGARPGGGGPAGEGDETTPPSAERLAKAAQALQQAGLLAKLAPALQQALEQAKRADGTFDAGRLAVDPATLQALGEALRGLAEEFGDPGQPGQGQGALGGLDPQALRDLQDVLEQFGGGAGEGTEPGDGQPGEGAGRGGVDRGPGHAALQLTEDAQGGADAKLPLPKGQALPSDWVPVGSEKRAATVDPQRSAAPGSAAAAGRGGASWQLDLAPRHRAVLQRYFGAEPAPAKDKR